MKPETVNNVLRHLKGIVAALEKERKEMLAPGSIQDIKMEFDEAGHSIQRTSK